MQAVSEIVLRQLDFRPVNRYFPLIDAVRITADSCSKITGNMLVVGYTVKA